MGNIFQAAFNSAQNFITNHVSTSTREKVVNAANNLLTVFTKPFAAIKDFSAAKAKTEKESVLSLVAQADLNVIAATAPFTAGVKSFVSNIVVKPITKVIAGITAAIAIPAVIANPKIVTNIPDVSNLASFGVEIGEFSKNPSLVGAEQIVKNHPLSFTVGLLGAGVLGGKALAFLNTAYNSYLTRQDNKPEQPAAPNVDLPKAPAAPAAPAATLPVNNNNLPTTPINNSPTGVIPTNTAVPTLPATQIISSGTTKKRKKHKIKQQIPTMKQTLNVAIINNSNKLISKKYLNAIELRN